MLPCDVSRCAGNNCKKKEQCLRYLDKSKKCIWTSNLDPIWCITNGYSKMVNKDDRTINSK